jgi:hypothetical protein
MNQTAPGQQQNPYDFILNPGQKPKKRLIGSGNSLKSRILLIAGLAAVLMVVIYIVMTILGNAGKGDINTLKKLASQQVELIRIADMGADKAVDIGTRSFAITAETSLLTDQKALEDYLEKQEVKLTKLELNSQKDEEIDNKLEAAISSNRYDDVFREILTDHLNDYAKDLKSAYNSTGNKTVKALLKTSYENTEALLK